MNITPEIESAITAVEAARATKAAAWSAYEQADPWARSTKAIRAAFEAAEWTVDAALSSLETAVRKANPGVNERQIMELVLVS